MIAKSHIAMSSHPWTIKLLLQLLFIASMSLTIVGMKPKRLTARLIHRDSIYSPFYDPNMTLSDRAKYSIEDSYARFNYLTHSSSFSMDDIRAGLKPESRYANQFMASFSIGEPPVPQLLTMDSGSSLTWVQCLPCVDCFKQETAIFDPAKSTTYANLSCGNPLICPKCESSNLCTFMVSYLDGSFIVGDVGTDKFTFTTRDEGVISTSSDIIFGCGHHSSGFDGQPSGNLGLGSDGISIVDKLGKKFSYCIGDIRNQTYTSNILVLGDGAILEGDVTPIEIVGTHYYLNMEGITLGEKLLDIDPSVFKRRSDELGGVVIDSGTTISFLVEGAYTPLKNAVSALLDGKLQRIDDPSRLCYKGDIARDLTGFPVVLFQFSGAAELALDVNSLFQIRDAGSFCMAVSLAPKIDLNIIGIMAQQGYNYGYDLNAGKLYLQRIDCELLD